MKNKMKLMSIYLTYSQKLTPRRPIEKLFQKRLLDHILEKANEAEIADIFVTRAIAGRLANKKLSYFLIESMDGNFPVRVDLISNEQKLLSFLETNKVEIHSAARYCIIDI